MNELATALVLVLGSFGGVAIILLSIFLNLEVSCRKEYEELLEVSKKKYFNLLTALDEKNIEVEIIDIEDLPKFKIIQRRS